MFGQFFLISSRRACLLIFATFGTEQTAFGAVRVAVTGVGKLSFANCLPANGTEVIVQWNTTQAGETEIGLAGSGMDPVEPPLTEFIGGAVGLSFEVPAGSVLYAYHV